MSPNEFVYVPKGEKTELLSSFSNCEGPLLFLHSSAVRGRVTRDGVLPRTDASVGFHFLLLLALAVFLAMGKVHAFPMLCFSGSASGMASMGKVQPFLSGGLICVTSESDGQLVELRIRRDVDGVSSFGGTGGELAGELSGVRCGGVLGLAAASRGSRIQRGICICCLLLDAKRLLRAHGKVMFEVILWMRLLSLLDGSVQRKELHSAEAILFLYAWPTNERYMLAWCTARCLIAVNP
jgi:hypothetical protein